MAKIVQSQGFSKAVIYYDEVLGRWMLEETGKDSAETFDVENDILKRWMEIPNISISLKCEDEYSAVRGETHD